MLIDGVIRYSMQKTCNLGQNNMKYKINANEEQNVIALIDVEQQIYL